jgi:F-box-like
LFGANSHEKTQTFLAAQLDFSPRPDPSGLLLHRYRSVTSVFPEQHIGAFEKTVHSTRTVSSFTVCKACRADPSFPCVLKLWKSNLWRPPFCYTITCFMKAIHPSSFLTQQCGSCCSNISQLPPDLLTKILSCLDKSTLRSARIVCKAFHRASVPCTTSLTFTLKSMQSWLPHALLAHLLHALASVTHLCLTICGPPDAATIAIPSVASTLRCLHVAFTPQGSTAGSEFSDLAATLALATGLTHLAVHDSFLSFSDMARALQSCCSLQRLQVINYPQTPWSDQHVVADAILAIPALRDLDFHVQDVRFWKAMVLDEHCRISRLQKLAGVSLSTEAEIGCIAALTQLTYLEVEFHGLPRRLHTNVARLSNLSALQVLHVNVPKLPFDDLCKVVVPLTRLRELHVKEVRRDVAALDALFARLPALTGFRLGQNVGRKFPKAFLSNGFAGLRDLFLCLATSDLEGVSRFGRALTGLERLKILCYGTACAPLLSHLSPSHSLTCLHVHATTPGPAVSAKFLTGFPRLKALCLSNVLDAACWDDDVGSIAALKEVTELAIGNQGDPIAGLLSEAYGPGNCGALCSSCTLNIEQLQPLTALRQLEHLMAWGSWARSTGSPEFWEPLQCLRREMGFPPTRIDTSSVGPLQVSGRTC